MTPIEAVPDPKHCDLCGGVLPRLANGMQWWAAKDGARLHVECAVKRQVVASDDEHDPTAQVRLVSQTEEE